MSEASSAVTYTSVYTDSEPGKVFWGAEEELSDGVDVPKIYMQQFWYTISKIKDTSSYQFQLGSSEGDGIVPEVLDEPKDISISSSSSLSGFDAETKDISRVDEIKADENKADKEKATKEQAKEEPPVDEQAGDEQLVDNQARNKEAGGAQAKDHVPELIAPNTSSNLTLSSSEYGNQFIISNLYVLIFDTLKDTTKKDIQSMVDVPIHQVSTVVQRTPLVDTVIFMVTEKSKPTKTPTPSTTQAQVTSASEFDPSSKFDQALFSSALISSTLEISLVSASKPDSELLELLEMSFGSSRTSGTIPAPSLEP
nr:hypothetical protein [Tanacetum cinerariifolium]